MDDSKQIITQIIKKQMEILGADITLARVRNVPGIKVDESGNVVSIEGNTQILLSQLMNQFVELSGMIVKKTMESILALNPSAVGIISQNPNQISATLRQEFPTSGVIQKPPVPGDTPANNDEDKQTQGKQVLAANKDIEGN